MIQKFKVGICTFSYGGNGGISSEVPDIREWMIPLVAVAQSDPRVEAIQIWNLSDTPITMTRNRAVLQARERGCDFLLMVDSDMKPDLYDGLDPLAKQFFPSSFDFLVNHYHKGPACVGAPYCGPPPNECVYVFRWANFQNEHPNPDFALEMYDRHTAAKMVGIQECAALPTGLLMYDMRLFDLTEPKKEGDKPWFYYEWKDIHCTEKASTEDVTNTRDLSLVGTQKLGYNPLFCNWDAWAGHWKPKCVGKPTPVGANEVASKLKESWDSGYDGNVKLIDIPPQDFPGLGEGSPVRPGALSLIKPTFDGMGMDLPPTDADALRAMIEKFCKEYGRAPRVLEVGSWAGRSAIIMAESGAACVECVDTWAGSLNDNGTSQYDGSRGKPLSVFLANTTTYRRNGLITFLPGKSPQAAERYNTGEYDIVYLDAEHDYESVKADIEAWRRVASVWLAGHDYHSFEGVRKAVLDSSLVPEVQGNVWRAVI